MPIRVAVFSALNRDMEVARYKGSALANKIIESLDHGPKYTYLIGHDTNLANLGEIFDLNWKLPGRDQNENTPGGYLTFEKWSVNGPAGNPCVLFGVITRTNSCREGDSANR